MITIILSIIQLPILIQVNIFILDVFLFVPGDPLEDSKLDSFDNSESSLIFSHSLLSH